jgi:hypothetical protein
MSHPGAISCRCNLTISRMRRRMRLRRTAPPSVFLMLQPNRLTSRPLGRRKTANSRPDFRRPSRYTASYSTRRTNRHARGNPNSGRLDARETVAPFLASLRKDSTSTWALHACAEAVLFVTAAHMGLKSTFRQRWFSSRSRCSYAREARPWLIAPSPHNALPCCRRTSTRRRA